jgi:hypothetical protein
MSAHENTTLMAQFGAAMNDKDAAFMGAHPGLRDSLPMHIRATLTRTAQEAIDRYWAASCAD